MRCAPAVLCSDWLAVSNVNVPAITAVKSTLSAGNEQGQIVGAITAIQVCTAYTAATSPSPPQNVAMQCSCLNDVIDEEMIDQSCVVVYDQNLAAGIGPFLFSAVSKCVSQNSPVLQRYFVAITVV